MNDQPQREETIFNAAIQLPTPEQRAAYLLGACGDDDQLRQRLQARLTSQEKAATLLETSPVNPTASVAAAPTLIATVIEKPGDRIGRYKLLQQIGEGGCGVVYMAEQEEPVRRRVALKVIKLGMDTRQVIARFEAERQALALMDHPNIAKVLDAGASETGRPFFVMELVRGVRITEYCDQNNLLTTERLNLFTQVCQAIQHAHQKGIIHRDIKPSNILVTPHDGVPVPKVIDFGIAKATNQQRLTDKTVFTEFQQFLGTPAYMSPEQAEMSSMDIDTRSDIYSLGVLLYELLTGRLPFEAKDLFQAGLNEMRRIIREVEPPRPSTRLTSLSQEEITTVARHRRSEPPRLISNIRGELDWIVMKCLEKDRTLRYETANGLALDIQRHLNNEPVVVAAPSALYKFTKFARRNRMVLATATAILILLIASVTVSTWQAVRATRAEIHFKTEANKSKQVATFLQEMLRGVGPSVAMGRDTKMLREILDKTAERVGKELKDQPAVEADLLSTLGEVYLALDKLVEAEAMFQQGLTITARLFGDQHVEAARFLRSLANVLLQKDKLDEAEGLLRKALAIQRTQLSEEHQEIAGTLDILGSVLRSEGKLVEAETVHRKALAMQTKLLGSQHPEVAITLNNLGIVLRRQGKVAEAQASYREALAIQRKLLKEEDPEIIRLLNNLSVALSDQGKFSEAEGISREVLRVRKKLLGEEHSVVANSLHNLGTVVERQGRLIEAEAIYREALAMRHKLNGPEHTTVAESLDSLGGVLARQTKLSEAEVMYREALTLYRKLLPQENDTLATSISNLGSILALQGKPADAETMFREALSIRRQVFGTDHPKVADSLGNLGLMMAREGKMTEAETAQREALAILESKAPDHWTTFEAKSRLGEILVGQKKYTQAHTVLVSGYEGLKQRQDKIPAYQRQRLIKYSIDHLVQLCQATGQPEQAAEWKKILEQFDKTDGEKSAATSREPEK